MKTPLIYIIVLSWNSRELTTECIESIEKINYPRYVTLLVDNASSDDSVEHISKNFPNVKIIVNQANLRFAGGNNVGIDHAMANGADYVLLLNNDTIVDPDFLSKLVQAANDNPDVGILGPKIYYYNNPKMIWFAGGAIDWRSGWTHHIGIHEIDTGQYNRITETDYITGCCMLVKRNVIERIGKLDESYVMYGEDVDWCIRASRAGFKLLYVPSSIIWHKVSASSGGNFSWFKNWNKLKSLLRLMYRWARWYHWMTIPVMLPLKIFLAIWKLKD
ncbi:MAG: glycosyltransferase family 2 protein [Candidatus Kryptoniota bacterium]